MGKLHELLAVEGEQAGMFKALIEEAVTTFSKRADHFMGHERTYQAFKDTDAESFAPERKELVTTVFGKLAHVWQHCAKYLDTVLQKESTNQQAQADLVVDGCTIAQRLPATFLLGLETKLKTWRAMFEAIPTLQPGVAWEHDPVLGEDVYVTKQPEEVAKTKKTLRYQVMVPATDKHPAQVEKWHEDLPVGKYIVRKWCGMLSPAEKSNLLARLDVLSQAVKQARQRANCQEVTPIQIGQKLIDFLMTGCLIK